MPFTPFLSLDQQHHSIERELKGSFAKILKGENFILGEEVAHFESEFAAFQKAKYCVAVANGHDALLISLKALNIGKAMR